MKEYDELRKAIEPAVEWMKKNADPMSALVILYDGHADLYNGVIGIVPEGGANGEEEEN